MVSKPCNSWFHVGNGIFINHKSFHKENNWAKKDKLSFKNVNISVSVGRISTQLRDLQKPPRLTFCP